MHAATYASLTEQFLGSFFAIPFSYVATIYLKVLFAKDAHTISNETHNVLMCAAGYCVNWC